MREKPLTLCKYFSMKAHYPLFILILFALSCTPTRYETIRGYAQGGSYTIKYNSSTTRTPKATVAAAIDSLLREIDFSISGYNGNSLLSRRNAGEDITPDRHFKALLILSDKYSRVTRGSFDPYGAPLYDAWGFGFKGGSLPTAAQVDSALLACRERRKLNFNAIAQGYSCDIVADYLRSIGVSSMLVDIGEIYCEGLNPKGEPWTIGVDSPTDGNNTPGAQLRGVWNSGGNPCGIVTSGNYRKFYVRDGRKYAHTIDPRSGYPVEHSLLSATVVAPSAAEADAIATACMVLGPEDGKELILSLPEVEAYFIMSDGTWASMGFKLVEQ